MATWIPEGLLSLSLSLRAAKMVAANRIACFRSSVMESRSVGLKCGRSRRRDYTDSAGTTLRRKVYGLGMEGTLEGYQADLSFCLEPALPTQATLQRLLLGESSRSAYRNSL